MCFANDLMLFCKGELPSIQTICQYLNGNQSIQISYVINEVYKEVIGSLSKVKWSRLVFGGFRLAQIKRLERTEQYYEVSFFRLYIQSLLIYVFVTRSMNDLYFIKAAFVLRLFAFVLYQLCLESMNRYSCDL